MWDDGVSVGNIDGATLRELRERLGLSQAEVARRMMQTIVIGASERACVRCISELENNRRYVKERQMVEALLYVLGVGPKPPPRLPWVMARSTEAVGLDPDAVALAMKRERRK